MANFYPDPIGALIGLQKALNSHRSADWFGPSTSSVGAYPPINIFRQGDDLVLITELPGCRTSDLEIQVQGNRVQIAGKKRIDYPEEASLHRRERVEGTFSRTITLPVEVDAEQIKAEYRNGILALHLPRPERDRPKSIAIN